MSDTIENPPSATPAEPPRPKRNNLLARRIGLPLWVAAVVAVMVLAALIGSLAGLGSEHARADRLSKQVTTLKAQAKSSASASPSSSDSTDNSSSSDTTAADSSSSFSYDKDTMYMTLKTTSKKCFGSAGCNVSVQPQLGMLDTSGIPDDASGQVTFEITGGDDGPVIDTVDLTGTKYDVSTEDVSTSNSGVKLKVKITDVTTY